MDRTSTFATASGREKDGAAGAGHAARAEHFNDTGRGAAPGTQPAAGPALARYQWSGASSAARTVEADEKRASEVAGLQTRSAANELDGNGVRAQLGRGQSLPGTVRARMSSAFGAGFGDVRLHTDATAARLTHRLNARAFTIGRDVAFGPGQFRPGTPAGDVLIAHELAHVVQQGETSSRAQVKAGGESADLEQSADRSAMSAVVGFFGAAAGSLGGLLGRGRDAPRNARPAGGSGLRLQRCKSAKEKAHDKEVSRLGGLQYDFLEQQRIAEQERLRKEAEEKARNAGLPPPAAAPTVSVDDIIQKEAKASEPPKPADAWTTLKPEVQDKWKQDAKDAWKKVVASVAGTELENVVKGKSIDFRPKEALEQSYFGAQLGNKLLVGMQWVSLALKDPKNVWPNIAHELGGHFEYGETYGTEIMQATLKKLPEAERVKWQTDPVLRQKFFMTYEYAETEIFAELRERRYTKPESGPAPVNPTDDPDVDVPRQLREIKRNMHPEVAKAVVAEIKRRVDASSSILERDKLFFAAQIKVVFGGAP